MDFYDYYIAIYSDLMINACWYIKTFRFSHSRTLFIRQRWDILIFSQYISNFSHLVFVRFRLVAVIYIFRTCTKRASMLIHTYTAYRVFVAACVCWYSCVYKDDNEENFNQGVCDGRVAVATGNYRPILMKTAAHINSNLLRAFLLFLSADVLFYLRIKIVVCILSVENESWTWSLISDIIFAFMIIA